MVPELDERPVIPEDRGDDLQGREIAEKADRVAFMAGNQFLIFCDPKRPAASSPASGSRRRRAEA